MPTESTLYRFFEGPGHAWLEVPAGEVTPAMGISACSWRLGDKYYLEEDVDVMRFLRVKYGPDFSWSDLGERRVTMYRNAPGYQA